MAQDEFLAFIAEQGVTFEEAKAECMQASSDHSRGETPFYAESIARFALSRGRS